MESDRTDTTGGDVVDATLGAADAADIPPTGDPTLAPDVADPDAVDTASVSLGAVETGTAPTDTLGDSSMGIDAMDAEFGAGEAVLGDAADAGEADVLVADASDAEIIVVASDDTGTDVLLIDTDDSGDPGVQPFAGIGGALTGTADPVYDLVSVLYHALQGAETTVTYADDAAFSGDAELLDFFAEVQVQDRIRAQRAKVLLRRYLAAEADAV